MDIVKEDINIQRPPLDAHQPVAVAFKGALGK
jgi:hypothetical protein